jgi:hypothetical protein
MNRFFTLFLGALMMYYAPSLAADFETATQAVKNMGVGWNLGNTLDANNGTKQGLESETYWGQPTTKPELMKMMKEAGFNTIRIPVTWYNHMDDDGKVDAEWMKRVHEIVDYVISQGMYCIVNVHHDTGDGKQWLHADMSTYTSVKSRYEYLWKQIAEEFKDYDEKLLFESYNEMLDKYNSWCFATFNSPTRYVKGDADDAYEAINKYAQSFVDVVRATGGNNAQRNLIVNTYGACNGGGNWNTHLKDPLKEMKYPNDAVTGHIAFQVHAYPSIVNDNNGKITNRPMTDIKKEIDDMVSDLKNYLVAKGGPVIVGEWGTSNSDKAGTDYAVRRDHLFQFVDYFVQKTKENGIATIQWMGLSDGVFRSEPAFNQPDLAERIVKAYYGSSFEGKYPTMNTSNDRTVFEGEKQLEWGTAINISGDLLSSIGEDVKIQMTYTQNYSQFTGNDMYDDIQFYYGDWSAKPVSFIADGSEMTGADFSPSNFYKTGSGTSHITTFSFNSSVLKTIFQKGLIIHGHGVLVKKVVLTTKSEAGGISGILFSPEGDDKIYNLSGQRITSPTKGIYIQNGRKIVIR